MEGEAPTSGRGRVWIIDPLDGTVNYANGIPFFCVSIGLVIDGRPSVGVVHDPSRAETFAATVDGPAVLMSTLGSPSHAIEASDKERLSDFVISMALSGRAVAARARNVRKAIRISRSMGSAALALAYVANGRFDAFEPLVSIHQDLAGARRERDGEGQVVVDHGVRQLTTRSRGSLPNAPTTVVNVRVSRASSRGVVTKAAVPTP